MANEYKKRGVRRLMHLLGLFKISSVFKLRYDARVGMGCNMCGYGPWGCDYC